MNTDAERTATSEPRTSVRADLRDPVEYTVHKTTHPFRTTWLFCFLAAAALYASTANRGAQWQDSGYFILRAVTGESVNPLGLALTHPLHYRLSRIAIGLNLVEPAFAVTLISSLAAAVAIANILGCVWTLTGSRPAAILAAASIALANTFWQLATIAETYTITAALLTAECWCMIAFLKSAMGCPVPQSPAAATHNANASVCKFNQWAFLGMWFFNGLSLSNHNLALLTIPAIIFATLWTLKRGAIRPRSWALSAAIWLLGAALYGQVVVHQALQSGDFTGTLQSALFGRSYGDEVLSTSVSLNRIAINLGFVLLNFPNLFLPAALAGLWYAAKSTDYRIICRPLLLGLLIHVLFACRYPVADQHYFFVPSYLFLALFAGIVFARLVEPRRNDSGQLQRPGFLLLLTAMLLVLTPVIYAFVPQMARRFDALSFFERNKPYRNDYNYLFLPWSVTEHSADRMSREAMELAGEQGVIVVEDRMAEFAVRYQLEIARRAGVTVSFDIEPLDFERFVDEGRTIVLVPRNADQPTTLPLRGSWQRKGDLYVFEP